jgi:CubicO group peptidase (beta-lactamase class C family)
MLFISLGCTGAKPDAPPWPVSTPEAQGVDSEELLKIFDQIDQSYTNIHSIIILRHGKLILEVYYPPFRPQDKHDVMSVTKSVISALIGIAQNEGKIQSVDQPVVDFFSGTPIQNLDMRKKNIHIHDLLNMTSGMAGNDEKMAASDNQSQFALDLPMARDPGVVMDYISSNLQILSTVLQKTTGKTAEDYAREKLFSPMDITNTYWPADPTGTSNGWAGLMLTPRDMAKVGTLYLQKGKWKNQQIIPAAWVEASSAVNSNQYGYAWWQPDHGYSAFGMYGQLIYVIPDLDMVVVSTAGSLPDQQILVVMITDAIIVNAVKSDQALPKNDAAAALAKRIETIQAPPAQTIPPLPAVAKTLNEKKIRFDDNKLGWEFAQFSFQSDQAWLSVKTTADAAPRKFAVGLDGLYRYTAQTAVEVMPTNKLRTFLNRYEFNFLLGMPVDGDVAMKGAWISDQEFLLTVQDLRDIDREMIKFAFSPEKISVSWFSSIMGDTLLRMTGKLE